MHRFELSYRLEGFEMKTVVQIIEMIKNDVNQEESMTLSLFHAMLDNAFKVLLLFGVPFLLYVIWISDLF
jgi:hypothetical protein